MIYLDGDNYLPGSLLIEEQFTKLLFPRTNNIC